jgi:pimeloyl-ACP methyl ester carboxylesterase
VLAALTLSVFQSPGNLFLWGRCRAGAAGRKYVRLSAEEVLYAVQQPTAAALFGGRTTAAAWQTKPSWYAVSKLDETISPDLERFLANRMKAHTIEVNAGHLSLVSHPREIADLILEAAGRGKQAR